MPRATWKARPPSEAERRLDEPRRSARRGTLARLRLDPRPTIPRSTSSAGATTSTPTTLFARRGLGPLGRSPPARPARLLTVSTSRVDPRRRRRSAGTGTWSRPQLTQARARRGGPRPSRSTARIRGARHYADAVVEAVGDRKDPGRRGSVVRPRSQHRWSADRLPGRRAGRWLPGMIPSPGEAPGDWWQHTVYRSAVQEQAARDGGKTGNEDPYISFYHDVPRALAEETMSKERAHPSEASTADAVAARRAGRERADEIRRCAPKHRLLPRRTAFASAGFAAGTSRGTPDEIASGATRPALSALMPARPTWRAPPPRGGAPPRRARARGRGADRGAARRLRLDRRRSGEALHRLARRRRSGRAVRAPARRGACSVVRARRAG